MSEVTPNVQAHDYEERDLPLMAIFWWTSGLFVLLAAVLAFVYGVYGTPKAHLDPKVVLERPMTQPTLQPRPQDDMKVFRKAQQEHMSTYGWVDRKSGIVRLPISRAMDLVVERGLPSRKGSAE